MNCESKNSKLNIYRATIDAPTFATFWPDHPSSKYIYEIRHKKTPE